MEMAVSELVVGLGVALEEPAVAAAKEFESVASIRRQASLQRWNA